MPQCAPPHLAQAHVSMRVGLTALNTLYVPMRTLFEDFPALGATCRAMRVRKALAIVIHLYSNNCD